MHFTSWALGLKRANGTELIAQAMAAYQQSLNIRRNLSRPRQSQRQLAEWACDCIRKSRPCAEGAEQHYRGAAKLPAGLSAVATAD